MRKMFYFIALCLINAVTFTSCKSGDQKKAEDYLRERMKSPSSFKVVDCSLTEVEASSTFDTIYHVQKIYGEAFGYGIKGWISIDNVQIDSIQVTETQFPAAHSYRIEYDAANSYGAVIRDSETIYVVNEECYTLDEFIEIGKDVLHPTEMMTLKVEKPRITTIEEGEWVRQWELFDISR